MTGILILALLGYTLIYTAGSGQSILDLALGREGSQKIDTDVSESVLGNVTGSFGPDIIFGNVGQVTGDTRGLSKDMMQFLQLVAGRAGPIRITSGRRPGDSGSRHSSGNGADIAVGGDARNSRAASRRGDQIAVACAEVCGKTRVEALEMLQNGHFDFGHNLTWNGHSVELGWKTLVGGNHYNHVHAGFDT